MDHQGGHGPDQGADHGEAEGEPGQDGEGGQTPDHHVVETGQQHGHGQGQDEDGPESADIGDQGVVLAPFHRARAIELLGELQRKLYGILAEEPETDDDDGPEGQTA